MIPTPIAVIQGLRIRRQHGINGDQVLGYSPMSQIVKTADVHQDALRQVKSPAKQAMVLICRRCERRVGKDGDAGRRFARRLRKLGRDQLGKGAVRTVFTGCMSLCPRNSLAVAIVPGKGAPAQAPRMCIADTARPKAAARALLALLGPVVSEA